MKYRFGLHDQTDYKVKENPPKNQPFPQFFFQKNLQNPSTHRKLPPIYPILAEVDVF